MTHDLPVGPPDAYTSHALIGSPTPTTLTIGHAGQHANVLGLGSAALCQWLHVPSTYMVPAYLGQLPPWEYIHTKAWQAFVRRFYGN